MARSRVSLDHAGMAQMLKSGQVAAQIRALGSAVEANVRGNDAIQRNGMPVQVSHGTTDRARTTVSIAHAGGLAVQAKHGVLTRAAAAVGLQVRSR